ncbi:hypothetical protein PAPHI01_0752 [Pancytospora philotis]|nr:hypothetical protein PAPHI01_0752 [Pancytospora philotis]
MKGTMIRQKEAGKNGWECVAAQTGDARGLAGEGFERKLCYAATHLAACSAGRDAALLARSEAKNTPAAAATDTSTESSTDADSPHANQVFKLLKHHLRDIKRHGRWLKTAIVSRAFAWACSIGEPQSLYYSLELEKFEQFEPHTLLIGLVYIQKAARERSLDFEAFFNLFLICNILAFKSQEDYSTLNYNYAEQWGIPVRRLNEMEVYALENLNYNISVEMCELLQIIIERMRYLNSRHLT